VGRNKQQTPCRREIRQEGGKMSKYICDNCGKSNTKHVKAMVKAGFEPRHLRCKECGQQTIKAKE
jgi:uncharacterized Zn finger protein